LLLLRQFCETLSLKFKEGHRLIAFESRVMPRIFGLNTNEMVGDWRKLSNEELHNLHSAPNVTGMMK
jgi:hypothetical protein